MSDKQRTNDAQVIAQMQQHIAKKVYEDEPQGDMFLISTNMSNIIEYALAERRERMRLTAERDAARAEVERLRAACSRKEDVYPTETVITRSASDLLVEFSQFAFFLGDIRKSKEASYRAQYILAALGIESEASE